MTIKCDRHEFVMNFAGHFRMPTTCTTRSPPAVLHRSSIYLCTYSPFTYRLSAHSSSRDGGGDTRHDPMVANNVREARAVRARPFCVCALSQHEKGQTRGCIATLGEPADNNNSKNNAPMTKTRIFFYLVLVREQNNSIITITIAAHPRNSIISHT